MWDGSQRKSKQGRTRAIKEYDLYKKKRKSEKRRVSCSETVRSCVTRRQEGFKLL